MSIYLGDTPLAHNAVSRNIGEIIQSTIPLSDAGLHLLDGALISSAGSYAKFVNYIAGLVSNYPDLFTTEANWQSSVSTYGVCGKFVYDSTNNTVRLPKITGFTEGTTDVTALGDLIEAGLPNITGSFSQRLAIDGYPLFESGSNGAMNVESSSGKGINGTTTSVRGGTSVDFNASRSNSIYGNSTTVQPQAIKVLYYIVIANSTVTVSIESLDVTEVGKAFVDLFYPVGSIYVGITSTCPLAAVKGTWELVSSGRVLQGADSGHSAGTTIEAGLPNIEGTFSVSRGDTYHYLVDNITGSFVAGTSINGVGETGSSGASGRTITNFDASRSSSIYGNSTTVQPPAYCVNIWKRTA